jgi:hypothetical protein
MAKKKKSAQIDDAPNGSASNMPLPAASSSSAAAGKKPANEPSTSALIICRNK